MERIAIALVALACSAARADEGMWTYNHFPSEKVMRQYGFGPSQEWLDHVRLSSARIAGGCSASFVSAGGLVMTNHHCAHACIEQLSNAKKDFVASGFYAPTEREEVKCPAMEIDQLIAISDVTDRVNAATRGLKEQKYHDALKAEMSRIEKECGTDDSVRCEVVTLYRGGEYNLYKYRRYQDVRLVFAPEFSIAFFGGDPDNFMFPRYDLDVGFLRIYESERPARVDHHFAWNPRGAADGELTFVSGHPGRTSRLATIAELEYQRDVALPRRLFLLSELRGLLTEYQNRGPEEKRHSTASLFGIENTIKALKGRYEALIDKAFFAQKVAEEQALRAQISSDPVKKERYAGAWDAIARAQGDLLRIRKPLNTIEQGDGFSSQLFRLARLLVRSAEELTKPNEKRLREYADSALPALKQQLFSAAPIYDEFEIATLTWSLTKLREELGPDDPFVRKVLGKGSPKELATSVIAASHLKDLKLRHQLFEGGRGAIERSNDSMIALARLVDPDARAVRKKYEDDIESVIKKSSELIAKAGFEIYGTSRYPDATFSLRLSYGQVKGYDENGKRVPPFTDVAGAFERATGEDPFALPASWLAAKPRLNLKTPFDFCSTDDIIGGNSGSPVINKSAEVVGLIFDGNIHSLGGEYGFDKTLNRAIAVDTAAITEALSKIYRTERLVVELTGGSSGRGR